MSNQIGSEKDKDQQRPGNPDRRSTRSINAQGQDKGRDQQRDPNRNK